MKEEEGVGCGQGMARFAVRNSNELVQITQGQPTGSYSPGSVKLGTEM